MSIFHEHADSAFLYMEVENSKLAEDVERLETDRKRDRDTVALSDQLRTEENARVDAERQVEKADRKAEKAEIMKLEVEKKRVEDRARDKDALLQKERDFSAKAMHELNNVRISERASECACETRSIAPARVFSASPFPPLTLASLAPFPPRAAGERNRWDDGLPVGRAQGRAYGSRGERAARHQEVHGPHAGKRRGGRRY